MVPLAFNAVTVTVAGTPAVVAEGKPVTAKLGNWLISAANPSPMPLPLEVVCKAPAVVGKFVAPVIPATKVLPASSTAMPMAQVLLFPPR